MLHYKNHLKKSQNKLTLIYILKFGSTTQLDSSLHDAQTKKTELELKWETDRYLKPQSQTGTNSSSLILIRFSFFFFCDFVILFSECSSANALLWMREREHLSGSFWEFAEWRSKKDERCDFCSEDREMNLQNDFWYVKRWMRFSVAELDL